MSDLQQRYKLRSSVAVTKSIKNRYIILSFFKTDIRQSFSIKVKDEYIYTLLFSFDGKQTLAQIINTFNITQEYTLDFVRLIQRLNQENILIECDDSYTIPDYVKYFKVFHFLENYYQSISKVNYVFNTIKNSRVMIIGLGGVGTWVAQSLVMSGVRNLVLVDKDNVEITNLHRQSCFMENDIGEKKIHIISKRLKEIDSSISIDCILDFLDSNFFNKYHFENLDLIINCADNPTVDINSLIVGEYCMKYNIPHIIGGGYNLHLSLLAHSIIPFKSACAKCLDIQLAELNDMSNTDIKKLRRDDRKIGSTIVFCVLAASIISLESMKILSGLKDILATSNIRKEFSIHTLKIVETIIFEKRNDCPWCGENGKYRK